MLWLGVWWPGLFGLLGKTAAEAVNHEQIPYWSSPMPLGSGSVVHHDPSAIRTSPTSIVVGNQKWNSGFEFMRPMPVNTNTKPTAVASIGGTIITQTPTTMHKAPRASVRTQAGSE
jgi:hypothetical protein